MRSFVRRFDRGLELLSRYGLIAAFSGTLILSVTAIVLRWLGLSLMWIEPLVRHLVFLSAFFGGSLATSKNVHIRIDLFTKLIERSSSKTLKWLQFHVVALFCFGTCVVLSKSAWDFYLVEKEFGNISFLDLHSSVLVGIIPFGMALISLRFLNQLLLGANEGSQHAPSGL